ncbi:MAG: tRNA preQ1(34) S-adenosylmethionine ribosyltransferase-isomerase QueA [Candidatus Marinimicrobia bacterium]|jgi:S-adenosylmethionine:tRNA ribosyltransferase-isomerase|nr:tRNA preQ1(34) S-adenosylmethionine ribosyltransferase-isomerase QueA [Candidatus Neomarinimicrobiota bacterium]MDP7025937.1 tRNA preQ1(34) S-adenosylmethionine ribosyltransferase-isomerase QueA [Candidatus Neomarinimicrobiota bacterium]MDP7437078.1 tRNA preQ1(34) S-adenosylmethionine ribosyltransferase-isomerase QueA [Candidatus Neomarinimicrobiota bacterium]MDP7654141.1 tRNA preQ1(34) S-adenosylmethionine ribosyltransferase-isomerase QueA [Candidatus Neomarinimicrobiota bacterium]|tara:strand:- start:1025 stop:2077 length:1053 start_codon:yes stop_codon:yes gene_type:complete
MFQKRIKLRLTDFDYNLPKARIAQDPAPRRDYAKMMVLHRKTKKIEHRKFCNLHEYMRKNDLLIINTTKVFPARLFAIKDRTDATVEVFLLRELENDLWEVLVKPARKVRIGNKLHFTDKVHCDVIDNTVSGGRVVRFDYPGDDFYKIIDGIGNSPLPPYINRKATKQDKDRYQTVYAANRGAVAAPTGGLHFTDGLIKKLKSKGVKIKPCTLHIGLGTFRPIQVEDLTRHQMDSEFFEVPPETAIAINEAREKEKKIVAVGTSSVRALETVVVSGFQVAPRRGWTDKFIYPPYDFKMTDGLITNFHMPKSTLLMLVSAFGDREFILDAYKLAIRKQYRFLSYGDSMLIL